MAIVGSSAKVVEGGADAGMRTGMGWGGGSPLIANKHNFQSIKKP